MSDAQDPHQGLERRPDTEAGVVALWNASAEESRRIAHVGAALGALALASALLPIVLFPDTADRWCPDLSLYVPGVASLCTAWMGWRSRPRFPASTFDAQDQRRRRRVLVGTVAAVLVAVVTMWTFTCPPIEDECSTLDERQPLPRRCGPPSLAPPPLQGS